MSVFYVFQGETYKQERAGGYVWSPQLDVSGNKNAGYTKMTKIRRGDFILHNNKGKLVAISVANTDCYDAAKPAELSTAKTTTDWNKDGYRVDTKYYDLDAKLKVTEYKDWLKAHHAEDSAFTVKGLGKTQYMCSIDEQQAIFLLDKVINSQKTKEAVEIAKAVLQEIISDRESEYDSVEIEEIDECLDGMGDEVPSWPGLVKPQEVTISSSTGREIPKRDSSIAAKALAHAAYKCEYSGDDKTFIRKNGHPYTEPHHLIPISKYKEFSVSVDAMENIVSLCSHCHNLLHYGRYEDKLPVLKKLYEERKDALKSVGLEITFEQLAQYYK